jgi:rhodanese-related sulfurtransferase
MKKLLSTMLISVSLLVVMNTPVIAGGGGDMTLAPVYDIQLNPISMREAESLIGKEGVYFFDVNTMELWAEGYIPGAIYFNVKNWKKLLPKNKDAVMIFYCANPLCTSSAMAARETVKIGYTGVRHMSQGIYGWRLSGRPTEKP